MNTNRRNFAAIVSVGALAACTTAATTTKVEQVIAQAQAVLPFVSVLAAGLAIAVPSSAGVVQAVTPYLNDASVALNTLSGTMAASEAAPIVTKIENAIGAAVEVIGQIVNAPNADPKMKQFGSLLKQAGAVVSLLNDFVNSVSGVIAPKGAALVVPRALFIRVVK